MKIVRINSENVRKITAIPVIGFAEYKIIPKGKVKLYYEMKSEFFEQNISQNLTLTDEQFEAWADDDTYIVKLILEAEKLEQIFIEEEDFSSNNIINPFPTNNELKNPANDRTTESEPNEPSPTITPAN